MSLTVQLSIDVVYYRLTMNTTAETHKAAHETIAKILHGLEGVIKGKRDTIRLIIAALLADGHVLLEDYPGSGKTTLTKALGKLIGRDPGATNSEILNFRRVQFTPDMLPGDVLGVNVFEPKSSTFRFIHGPVFAHVVLADEINRTGPKVQAAFLECMAEKQVTIDNVTHRLDELFFVVGTQNPLDVAGTYPLPSVQLDRFLLKLPMTYVDSATEEQILMEHSQIVATADSLTPVVTRSDILAARRAAQSVHVAPALRQCIVAIVQATRGNPRLQFGASTRAAIMTQEAIKGWAFVQGRDFATEDDLKMMLPYVMLHRLKFIASSAKPQDALMELAAPHLERLIQRGL